MLTALLRYHSFKMSGIINCATYSDGRRVANIQIEETTALEANFSLISISQNEVQKRFAGWAAIIAVPTMIAGIYGMNFKFMPELDWAYGYPVVVAFTVMVCGMMYGVFKRSGWL